MTIEPERDPAIAQAIGFLVMAAGKVEAWLATVLILTAYDSDLRAGLQKVSGMHVRPILQEFRRRGADLPEGLQTLLEPLRDPGGLIDRRDQVIHAIWLWADDGTVNGANLKKSIFRADGAEPPTISRGEIEAVTAGLDAVSERLGAWVLLKMLSNGPRPPE